MGPSNSIAASVMSILELHVERMYHSSFLLGEGELEADDADGPARFVRLPCSNLFGHALGEKTLRRLSV